MYLLDKKNKTSAIVIIILLIGLCLRLAFALTYLPLLGSETNHLPLARHISLLPGNFYFPLESNITNHLIFTDLIVKLGLSIFGENALGLRSFFIIVGFITLVIVYKIGLMYSKKVAIYALLIVTFNQYNIGHSGIADNPVIIVFFSALSIYIFWKGVNSERKLLWFLGPIWALAYLTQEQIVIFAPVFYLFLLLSPRYRIFSKSKEIIFSYFIFISCVVAHLLFIKFKGTCLEYFTVPGYIQFSHIPTLTGINFFLIRPICKILSLDYLMTINWEVPLMSGLSGIVLFSGIIYSLKRLKVEFIKLLWLLAASQVLIFSFIKSNTFIWGEPNWTKLSIIPAVFLAAIMLSELKRKSLYLNYGVYLLFIYMFFQASIFSFQPKQAYPPHRFATFVDYDIQFIQLYVAKEFLDKPSNISLEKIGIRTDYKKAINECIKALSISPNEARIHNYLSESLYNLSLKETAKEKWLLNLELEPFYTETFKSILSTYNDRDSDFYNDILCLKNGVQFLKERKPEEAMVEFRKTRLEDYAPSLYYYYLGIGYLDKGDFNQAERELKKSISFNQEFTRAHADLAKVFVLEKRLDEAEGILRGIIQSNPDYFLAYEYLGKLYSDKGEWRLAKRNYNQARNIIHVTLKGDYCASKLLPREY